MAMTTGSKVLHGSVLLAGVLSVVLFVVLSPSGESASPLEPNHRSSRELRAVKSPTAGVSAWSSGPSGSSGGRGGGGGGGGGGGEPNDPCNMEDIGNTVRNNGGFSMFKGFGAENLARQKEVCETIRQRHAEIEARRGR